MQCLAFGALSRAPVGLSPNWWLRASADPGPGWSGLPPWRPPTARLTFRFFLLRAISVHSQRENALDTQHSQGTPGHSALARGGTRLDVRREKVQARVGQVPGQGSTATLHPSSLPLAPRLRECSTQHVPWAPRSAFWGVCP